MELGLYKALKNQIQYYLPEIKTVRLFNEQFLHSNGTGKEGENENAFGYPCVFLQFHTLEASQLSAGVQEFNMTVSSYLGFKSFQTEDTKILELKEKLYYVMQRFQQGNFARLNRTFEYPDSNHGDVQIFKTDYHTRGMDDFRYIFNTGDTTTITGVSVTEVVVEVPSISITASGTTSDNGFNLWSPLPAPNKIC
jgi:hypothetical protein